jgi:metal-responsive CopG/Arc/MetJ family transcriptional regulator
MKTAISLPEKLFASAEITAKKLGVSRSRLFSVALQEYLENHSPLEITAQLNLVYTKKNSRIEPEILKGQTASLEKEVW